MTSTHNVFNIGKHDTKLINLELDSSLSKVLPPPKPLLIASPIEEGEYAVLVLLHGYLLNNFFYSKLIQHVSSHGFIVVAPQLYHIAGPDSEEEIKSAASITDWLVSGLQATLPPNIAPNLAKLAISGHSRGGKVAFALALNHVKTKLNFSALIGIDPVDGMDKGKQTNPPILTYVPNSLKLEMPALVIGSGLGGVKKNALFPPCAPSGVSHDDFFDECCEPKWHFVGEGYGHLDMLDDETKGLRGRLSYCLCKNGKSRRPMREFVGGVIVAFLNGYLYGDMKDLGVIRDGLVDVPIEFSVVSS